MILIFAFVLGFMISSYETKIDTAYKQGKSETLIKSTEKLLKDINIKLSEFGQKLDDFKQISENLGEVSKDVTTEIKNFLDVLNNFNNDVTKLYNLWKRSEEQREVNAGTDRRIFRDNGNSEK
ncbi:MAG: hypothetical protein ACOCWW_01815 [Bacteroidota bacterium]